MARIFVWITQWICGRDGRPSHPKLVQWAIVLSYLLPLHDCIQPVPPGVAAMLLAASFGYKAWQDWTTRAAFAFTTTSTVDLAHCVERHVEEQLDHQDVTHPVLAVRDPVLGLDPSRPQPVASPEEESTDE